jgi:hypothetical protein
MVSVLTSIHFSGNLLISKLHTDFSHSEKSLCIYSTLVESRRKPYLGLSNCVEYIKKSLTIFSTIVEHSRKSLLVFYNRVENRRKHFLLISTCVESDKNSFLRFSDYFEANREDIFAFSNLNILSK